MNDCVILARVSPATARENEGVSLVTQLLENLREAARLGLTVRRIIACGPRPDAEHDHPTTPVRDLAITWMPVESGGNDLQQRPGLLAALEATGEGWTLLAYDAMRLARSSFVLEAIRHQLRTTRRKLVLTTEHLGIGEDAEQDMERKLFRTIMGGLAEYERAKTAMRTYLGKRASLARGGRWGGQTPLGMRYSKGQGLELNPVECAYISALFEARKEGATYRQLATMPHPRGKRWATATLTAILAGELHPEVKAYVFKRRSE